MSRAPVPERSRTLITEISPDDFTWGGDGPAQSLATVRSASRDADGHDPLDEATDLHLKHRGLSGARLLSAQDAGFALLLGGELGLAVHPDHRGRGLGSALAAAIADEADSAWSHGHHPAADTLAKRHGLHPARELWVMRRDMSHDLAPLPASPDITVRSYTDGDATELLRINAAAFAGHPEQGSMDEANLAERMAEDWFDPAGLLVATDDANEDQLLGFHWTKRHDASLGEVYVVGIDPAAQGRGLGKLLTLAGLHHLADERTSEVLLYVEADNLPARAVYQGLGFGHAAADTHVHYVRS